MAVDQDALDHFGPLIMALEARIAVLEARPDPTGALGWEPEEYSVTLADGSVRRFVRV